MVTPDLENLDEKLESETKFPKYNNQIKISRGGCNPADAIYAIISVFFVATFVISIYMGSLGFHGFYVLSICVYIVY